MDMLKMPAPRADAIIPNIAAKYGVLPEVIFSYTNEDFSDSRLSAMLSVVLSIT